jgi:hypothetical protein
MAANGLELKRSILIPMLLRGPEAKPNGEAPGSSPTLALQISKNAPPHANRGTRLPSSAVVPAKSRLLGGSRLSKIPRSLRGSELLGSHKQERYEITGYYFLAGHKSSQSTRLTPIQPTTLASLSPYESDELWICA